VNPSNSQSANSPENPQMVTANTQPATTENNPKPFGHQHPKTENHKSKYPFDYSKSKQRISIQNTQLNQHLAHIQQQKYIIHIITAQPIQQQTGTIIIELID
jgi:hypothetical protein